MSRSDVRGQDNDGTRGGPISFKIGPYSRLAWLKSHLPAYLIDETGLCHYPSLIYMAKALTKSQITASIAETVGLTKTQAVQAIEALVALAYKNAKNSFTVPGLGKLVLVNRKARMGRNPATGATIKIPAKRVVKFRVAKAAKDAILGAKK